MIDRTPPDVTRFNADELEDYLATCFVHLTRNDVETDEKAGTAIEKLNRIINEKRVLAVRPHCLHEKKLPEKQRQEFRVACFSQTPVHRINRIVGKGHHVKLEPLGVVFHRESLRQKGIQTVQYLNSAGPFWSNPARSAADRIFQMNENCGFKGQSRWLLPFMSAYHDRWDFTWEQEWRILGNVTFEYTDVVCVILPEKYQLNRFLFELKTLRVVCPEWSREKIFGVFAKNSQMARSS